MLRLKCLGLMVLASSSVWAVPASQSSKLPIVDLGYVVQQATINETGQYYNFSNIRYAAAPVGNLRFAAPIAPNTINRTVNNGQNEAICPQAFPYWYSIMQTYLAGANLSTVESVQAQVEAAENALTINGLSAADSRTSEDCLFLDVVTPKSAFKKNASVPVLVWIYGGGYTTGSKAGSGNAASLIAKARENGGEGVVYVAMNYRLGLFGWLSGSKYVEGGGLPNAALHDQRLALEWIQANIHKFGGDPKRVTVLGESAGAGSIMHQITAYGGVKAPFQKAILQSPGFSPVPDDAQQNDMLSGLFTQAQSLISRNVTDVAALRKMDFKTLSALNRIVIARSRYGSFTFGPTVDGTFVPKMPGLLMDEGRFDHDLEVMTAHNSNEGLLFTSPFVDTEAEVIAAIHLLFPAASNATVDYITNTLYPPVYNGTYGYTTINQRFTNAVSEISFTCNARYTNLAFANQTYSYLFAYPPGVHGQDVAYTFFNGDTTTVNATIANAMQRYITNFVRSEPASPNGPGLPFFPKYQDNATMLEFNGKGVGALSRDTAANDRCAWWQQVLYAK